LHFAIVWWVGLFLELGSHAWFFLSQLALILRTPNSQSLHQTLKSGLAQSDPFELFIGAELTQLANFLASAFCSIPLAVSIIPGQPPPPSKAQDQAVGGGFFQVHATQAYQRYAHLAESASYIPIFPVHKLPRTPNWVVPNAVCTYVQTTLPLP
jgi:hypothetical protein